MHSLLSEEGSPKWDPAWSHCSHSSNSRLSERSPPERGKPLAWASILRLSKSWARMHPVLFSSMLIGWISHVRLGYCAKVCYECLCIRDVVHELWIEWFCMHEMVTLRFMSFTWCEYDICMRWFMELKWWVWHEFDMRHERVGINVAW